MKSSEQPITSNIYEEHTVISSNLSHYVWQHIITKLKKNPIAHEHKFHRMSAEPVGLSLIWPFYRLTLLILQRYLRMTQRQLPIPNLDVVGAPSHGLWQTSMVTDISVGSAQHGHFIYQCSSGARKRSEKSKCALLQPKLAILVSTVVHVTRSCRSGALRDVFKMDQSPGVIVQSVDFSTCLRQRMSQCQTCGRHLSFWLSLLPCCHLMGFSMLIS